MVKTDIRKIYAQSRNNLSPGEISDMTDRIVSNFGKLALQGAQVLLSYYPIPERNEFDVSICAQLLALGNKNLRVAWPKILPDGKMQAVIVEKNTPLQPNEFNIPEPVSDEIIEPQLIDVVFVPLLAFDNKGYRVGYGKGYYDRFLPQCAQDVVKIGFSFFESIESITDVNEYDVPLNYCITPTSVYEF
ncbi:MAG: 5-formyltetrahydrofolate cyclo-ligase [Chitinophagaceae bacterium]|nr:5-formyltetrahydrofolate cyclo-ligase [Chitinophagaceae bacterium]